MFLLALESTCDETAAAVLFSATGGEDLTVRSSIVASQHELHKRFQGVVPEIAARAHVERILPVIDEALKSAGVTLSQIDAVAAANTPGLAGSLLVGLAAAKTLCLVLGKPLVAVNHLHAHIYACRLPKACRLSEGAGGREIFPCVGLIVSGGHTHFYRCDSAVDFEFLGGTIDDAAGEAFDKVAAMLGLPYPGGPAIAEAAQYGDPRAYAFPRSFIDDDQRLEFSFSGLKTAVRYAIRGPKNALGPKMHGAKRDPSSIASDQIADVAASFQQAVVDCLVEKSLLALRTTNLSRLCVGGGVAANELFRRRLSDAAEAAGAELILAPLQLCTDNAVMGAIAFERLSAGLIESLDLDVHPGLVRS